MFSQIKDRKHIEQNFHSVARVIPRGGTCGFWEESKTLAWGSAMAPHLLRALVLFANSTCADQTEHAQPNQTIAVHGLDSMCTGFTQTNLCKIQALFKDF